MSNMTTSLATALEVIKDRKQVIEKILEIVNNFSVGCLTEREFLHQLYLKAEYVKAEAIKLNVAKQDEVFMEGVIYALTVTNYEATNIERFDSSVENKSSTISKEQEPSEAKLRADVMSVIRNYRNGKMTHTDYKDWLSSNIKDMKKVDGIFELTDSVSTNYILSVILKHL